MKVMKRFIAVGFVLGCLFIMVGHAGAALVVEFKETGSTVNAYVNGGLTASGTDTATVNVPFVTALSPFGFSFYSYMLDSAGGPISDILLVTLNPTNADITFASDSALFSPPAGAQHFIDVVEDGTDQLLFQMQSTGGNLSYTLTVWGQSTVETNQVPEPSTLLLLGSGLVGLAGFGKRKFRK